MNLSYGEIINEINFHTNLLRVARASKAEQRRILNDFRDISDFRELTIKEHDAVMSADLDLELAENVIEDCVEQLSVLRALKERHESVAHR